MPGFKFYTATIADVTRVIKALSYASNYEKIDLTVLVFYIYLPKQGTYEIASNNDTVNHIITEFVGLVDKG